MVLDAGLKFSFVRLPLSFHLCQDNYCCYVRASCFFHKPWTTAAQLSSIVLNNRVGSMVSDDVVNSLTYRFDSVAFHEFFSLFEQSVNGHLVTTPSLRRHLQQMPNNN